MQPLSPRRLAALAVPEGAVLAAALLLWYWEAPRTAATGFLPVYPVLVLAAGVLLAWRFRRPGILLSFVMLALADRALHHLTLASPAYHAVTVLVPVNLAVLTVIPFRGLTGGAAPAAVATLLAEAAAVVALRDRAFSDVGALLDPPLLPRMLTEWSPLGAPALLAFLGAAALFTVRTLWHPNAQDRGFLWALVATFIALHTGPAAPGPLPPPPPPIPALTYWFATAGLVLLVATIETSHALAFRDGLTGLPGRRAFDEALQSLRGTYTVAMVDLDRFKQINDTHGHDVGDQVLRMVAAVLARTQGGGRAYRYGGEEFAVLFPGRGADEVAEHLERLRAEVEATPFVLRAPDRPATKPDRRPRRTRRRPELPVTVSIGYAAGTATGVADARAVLEAADEALYRAKRRGRNRLEGRQAGKRP